MTRKYSVSEIQRMRYALGLMLAPAGPCLPAERSAQIEDQLRTYMHGGTEPAELEDAASDYLAARLQAESPC